MAVCALTKDNVWGPYFSCEVFLRSRFGLEPFDYHMQHWGDDVSKTRLQLVLPVLHTSSQCNEPAQCRFRTEACTARSLVQAKRERTNFMTSGIWLPSPTRKPWNRPCGIYIPCGHEIDKQNSPALEGELVKPCDTLSLQSSWRASSRASHLHYGYSKFEFPKQQWYFKIPFLRWSVTNVELLIYVKGNIYIYIYIYICMYICATVWLSHSPDRYRFLSFFGVPKDAIILQILCLRPGWSPRFASCSFSRMFCRHWSSELSLIRYGIATSSNPLGLLGEPWVVAYQLFCTRICLCCMQHMRVTTSLDIYANRYV